jgi:predicted membrane-bound spermidine synthase
MSKKTMPHQGNASQEKITFTRKYLYLIAFFEGGSVMAIELTGAKMIAPFFGTSLYVWASVLAVTLGGLAAGYFAGGWATYRFPPVKILFFELLAGTLLIAIMPFLAIKFMSLTGSLGLRLGSLFSSLSFMFLPLLFLGMISPTIIQLQNNDLKGTGKTAGTIYAISTIGGILMTLLMGFYLLPEWGIRKSVLLSAILLGIMAVLVVIIGRKNKAESVIGIFLLIILSVASVKSFSDVNVSSLKNLYWSEGILGQLTVAETKGDEHIRSLFINQIPQTYVNPDKLPASLWKYPHRLAMIASMKPVNSKALLIGLGGGSLAMELKNMGFSVDAVELDKRVPEVAEKYFGFKPGGVNVFIDDGRHYIRTADKKYDLVIIDVLNGEIQPHHMFTMESFAEMKKIMQPDGILIINNQGFLLGEKGLGARSIYKTLEESGYKVRYYFAGDAEISGDIHFIASPKDFEMFFNPPEKINECCRNFPVDYHALAISIDILSEEKKLDLHDAEILTDDKPVLATLYNYSFEEWRSKALQNMLTNLNTEHITLFR